MGDDLESWWSYAKEALRAMSLPTKAMMCLYLLSCVFAKDSGAALYHFGDIKLPPLFYSKFDAFLKRLADTIWRTIVFDFFGIHPPRQWPDFKTIGERPMPPAIWNESDVEFTSEWESHQPPPEESIAEKIRTYYSPCFIMLPPDHPLLQIGPTMKRKASEELALRCAQMKEQGYTYKQIGEKFGWKIQADGYVKKTRCSTARRYVLRGRALMKQKEAGGQKKAKKEETERN